MAAMLPALVGWHGEAAQAKTESMSTEQIKEPTKDDCEELLARGYKLYKVKHKIGYMSQNLSRVRKLNKFYGEQRHWWVSPTGDIVHWTKAMDEMMEWNKQKP